MSLLSLGTDAARLIGLPDPVSVATGGDQQSKTILTAANIEGDSLSTRYQWQILTKEVSFLGQNQESQGPLSSIAPDIRFILNDVIHNRTEMDQVEGPASPQEWQRLENSVLAGTGFSNYRIRGDELLLNPPPAAGDEIYFEYQSNLWVVESDGTTFKAKFTKDDDEPVLDEYLMTIGTRWRLMQALGLDYSQAFSDYEFALSQFSSRDATKRKYHLDEPHSLILSALGVPPGNWPI